MNEESKILGGRYEVGDLIGRGGMAEVHIGYDTRLGRTVAIKILRADLARDPSFQTRFRREAQAAAGLNHPAIVAVYDTGEDHVTSETGQPQAVPYIVMEYVEGHTVRDILKGDVAAPIDEAVEITAGVLTALDYAHHAGLVHRDIKPANVMLTPTGAVKVMDFGIARALADAGQTMTQTQAVVGTAQYLSPEQARGENVDARSDLYSAGCLLFELLTGRPPFVGDSPVSVAYQHVREEAPRPSQFASDVPTELDQVVLRALAKNRDERYASAQEFLSDLRAVMNGSALSPSTGAVAIGSAALGAGAAGVAAAAASSADTGENPTEAFSPATQGTAVMPAAAWGAGGASPAAIPPATGEVAVQDEEELVVDENERRRKIILWSSLGGAAVIAIIVILLLLLNGGPEEPVADIEVPDLAGVAVEEAQAQLDELLLENEVVEQASTDVEAGDVISTDPAAGELLFEGDLVTLTVSSGPGEVEIPSVRGLTEDEAVAELEAAGLTVSSIDNTQHDPGLEEGRVIGTTPESGETVDAGSEVELLVADGQIELVDLVGDTVEAARENISAAGLNAIVQTTETDEAEPGTVLSQTPGAGLVPVNSDVTIEVAAEPSTREVTNVVGQSQVQATSALQAAGFNVTASEANSDTVPSGTVISQNPSAGTVVAPGTTVNITVSIGPANPAPDPTATVGP
ncbi:Stk1 family PASTA domain-containing Ser/Thr kinase [Demequina zhanjiangensis]|uniref:non-specific serine/threonine protein kinase n=1 Tax=Demequina zhanjiangensis TaxID=3051659 RepID=A0ABT8FZS5_9MICO|nr:Stk1 family PASTA domain-containing Ser/Thr kinase [Demequina sp. SYSU T00b26]MDN4472396.1 Stk1 family PASTA domain-containing Ser/Thr kinase [Demequina sp. SYSU T00b26]